MNQGRSGRFTLTGSTLWAEVSAQPLTLIDGCRPADQPKPPHKINNLTMPVNVYTLMRLLGHESMATSQRYVTGAARETRSATAQNRSTT